MWLNYIVSPGMSTIPCLQDHDIVVCSLPDTICYLSLLFVLYIKITVATGTSTIPCLQDHAIVVFSLPDTVFLSMSAICVTLLNTFRWYEQETLSTRSRNCYLYRTVCYQSLFGVRIKQCSDIR